MSGATQTWPASVELRLCAEAGRTRLARCAHQGPLYVQRPFYPEGPAHPHFYLLHPPGGIVSGDQLQIRVDMAADSSALMTTPGAARVYRARDHNPQQCQSSRLRLDTGAILEWFPMETIVYDGASVALETTVELAEDSRFIGWELNCFGLPASNQPFSRGRFAQRYRIMREGAPVFVDSFSLDDSNRSLMLSGPAGLRGQPVTGIFLAGPFAGGECASLLQALRDATPDNGVALSWSGDWLVGRYLGASADRARKLYLVWWRILRPSLLGRDACVPRIWFT
ncbi:MAG: urease accessory protein UreD [Gammaproteobacteria bacterium]|nr:urease accessory protein UreD [Gammaproteobacteria bacterium]